MSMAFSIRNALQGEIREFAGTSGFKCVDTENLMRDIVALLASYREEDVPLYPDVYILRQPTDLRTLAPGAVSHKIGTLAYDEDTGAKILKNTAGLAEGGWAVYVGKTNSEDFEYGVFRAQRHSFATSAEESMQDLGDDASVIILRNRGHLTVELLNSQDSSFTVSLTAARPSSSSFAKHVDTLVAEIVADMEGDSAEQFSQYIARLLTGLLQQCHGTLIAVMDSSVEGQPPEMTDGVWLTPPVGIAEYHRVAVAANDAETLADLQAAESLLAGMVHSDGIVVFDTKGTIRAFRVFLAPGEEEKSQLDDKGGGRRRTFGLMKLRVETGMLCAGFIRSQDGETDCRGTNHA